MTGKMRRDGIRPEVIKRILIYGVIFFLLSVLQCSFFAGLRYLPATPDLILGGIAAVLLLDSRKSAAIAAVAGGFMIDALGGVGVSLSPVLYLAVAMILGVFAEKMLPVFWSWLVLMIPAILIRGGFTLMELWLFRGDFSLLAMVKQVILPEMLWTLGVNLPFYFLIRLCMLPLKDRRNRFPR